MTLREMACQEVRKNLNDSTEAKKYNIPVLYYEVNKVKRGFYEVTFRHITDTPNDTQHGEIVEKYVRMLEQTIKQQPEYWLWSHRRWKHKRPSENV